MAEPHALAGGSVLALGTVTLTGTILGLHYDALAIGFFSALVALLHMPTPRGDRSLLRVFSLVAGASFLAGVFAPTAGLAMRNYFPWSAALGDDMLRITAAALIGASVHMAIPLVFAFAAKKATGGGE